MSDADLTPRQGWRATFRSLRVRNFRLFIFGMFVSGISSWIGFVAAPLLVLELTDSGFMLGVDLALGTLPVLVFGAGAVAYAAKGAPVIGLLAILGAMLLASLVLAPAAVAAGLRISSGG